MYHLTLSRSHVRSPIISAIVLMASCQSLQAQQEQAPELTRFFTEAPEGWKRYRAYHWTLQGTATTEFVTTAGNTDKDYRATIVKKHCGDNALNILERADRRSYTGTARGRNSRYRFALKRKGSDKTWVLVEINADLSDSDKLVFATEKDNGTRMSKSLNCTPLRTFDFVLPDRITDPNFHAKKVEMVYRDGHEYAKLFFSDRNTKAPNWDTAGWLLLDVGHDWVIREGEYDFTANDGRVHCRRRVSHEYKNGSNEHLIIARSLWKSDTTIGEHYAFEVRGTHDEHEDPQVPESEFTLSAFGLPEPFDLAPEKPRWWFLAAVAGAVCLGVAILFWRLAARVATPR